VLALLDDGARRERLRTAAHELVARHYRWDAIGRDWRREVIGGEDGPSSTGQAPRTGRSVPSSVPAP
jgi:hypothetical protein